MIYCHPLSQIDSAKKFGGKAANLAKIRYLGHLTPETIVISRKGLHQFLVKNELAGQIKAYLDEGVQPTIDKTYKLVVKAVRQAVIPEELATEIREAADLLLQQSRYGLAVRSSALCEDSEKASFAGVFESFLGLKSADEVLEKVRQCWSSAWSPGALRYMDRMGIQPTVDGMAVILQEVIPAASSGLIYTADPRTGNPWYFALEAARGLSSGLMDGSGVGDAFYLDWDSAYIKEREIVTKSGITEATTEGIRQVTVGSENASEPALSDIQVREIANLARKLDEQFGMRMDIEWAFSPEGLYVLQARPLTALPDFFPVRLTSEQEQRSWKPAVATLPLRADQPANLLTPLYSHYSEREMWRRYQPDDIVFTSICRHELDVNGFRYWDAGKQPTFQDFFDDPGQYEPWIEKNEPRYRQRWDHYREELNEIKDIATRGIAETNHYADLIHILFDVTERLWDLNSFGWSGPQALGWMCEAALHHFLKEYQLEADIAGLLHGGADSYTFRKTRALQDLGRAISEPVVIKAFENQPLDKLMPHLMQVAPDCDFLHRFEEFCRTFGKAPLSWLDRPAFWSIETNDIQLISAVKKAYLGQSREVERLQEETLKKSIQSEQIILDKLNDPGNNMTGRFNRLLEWARYWSRALNDRHELNVGRLYERELLWQIARQLVREEFLEREEDLLVLRRADLEVLAQTGDPWLMKSTYKERRRSFHRQRRLKPPSSLGKMQQTLHEETTLPTESGEDGDGIFKGRGFGAGTVVGRAKKVTSLSDPQVLESLTADDILILSKETVFHYADWHSILTIIKAVVSRGRPSHHLAQVARECGIPLVGYVTGDLSRIQEGAELRVDGLSGVVKLNP